MQISKTLGFSLSFFLCIIVNQLGNSQDISGTDLLERAIQFHDKEGNWKKFKGKLAITMNTPNSSDRHSILFMDLPAEYFKSTVRKDNNTIESILVKDSCLLKLNGSTVISKKYRDSLRITCDRAKMMKNYYTYLYGLPMKLKDPGTIIAPEVRKKSFKGTEYLVLKVNYDEEVGKDTWYFYFDPLTYAMEVYQFFHDESKNDGEYILLDDILEVNGIKMPKTRAWYYNKNDKYLGTDILTKGSAL
ncbi:DUF6503 family protein [Maribacter sp. R77961]|jgi:hypothetical protein|uniref:DUF6503 family protein n=1 Tax=Maribacter sp. R77961 TaxID=3093871 RepID=UPI0037CB575F